VGMMAERWLILALLTFARSAMGFQFQSVAAVSPSLLAHFGMSFAAFGTLVGLYLLPGIAAAMPGGMLAQRYGDKLIACIGLLAMTLGGSLMATTDEFWLLTSGRIISGAGAVFLNVLVTKMTTDWFVGSEVASAFGILVISWPLGIALALVLLPLMAAAFGWQTAMAAPAVVSALAFVLMAFFYRTPQTAPKKSLRFKFDLTRRELFLAILAGLVWTFYNIALIIIPVFGPAYMIASGRGAAAAAALVSTVTWVMIPAIPIAAWIAERLGRGNITMHCSFFLTAAAIIAVATFGPSLAAFALIGLLFAPPAGLIMTLPGEAARPARRAIVMGIYFTCYYAGMGVLPALAGYARDLTGAAATPLWFAAAMVLAASLFLLQFRLLQRSS
jgi:predicted MFS family arabinose efflux permease